MISLIAAVTIVVNGQTMNFDQPPVEQAGRVFVPLRGIFEQLGASVVYQNGTINATGNGRTVSLRIGSTQATVDGNTQSLDSPPFVEGARTLVPLRFVATALGANVNWDDGTSTVTINGNGYSGGAPPPQQHQQYYGNADTYLSQRWPSEGTNWPGDQIRARFAQSVRSQSVRLQIDGIDITQSASITRDGFVYRPGQPLPPGRHRVRVTGVLLDGTPFTTGWEFHN